MRSVLLAATMVVLSNPVRPDTVAPNMLLLDGVMLASRIVAVGERGTVLHSPDLGLSWQVARVPVKATLTGVSFAPDGQLGWAVGHDAVILVTMDGGHSWRSQWQGTALTDSFLDVLALDDKSVIAVGAFGLYMFSNDGGITWEPRRLLEEDYHLNRITRGPGGTLYLAGEHGTLLRSHDRGTNWIPIHSPYDGSFYGILPLGEKHLLAHGLRGRLYVSHDDGDEWRLIPNEQRMLLLTAAILPDDLIIVAGQARAFFAIDGRSNTITDFAPEMTPAVAELLVLPDGSLLTLGEAGAALVPGIKRP
jgi:photosystem II stability/assembly factor-like uncharacterized protein